MNRRKALITGASGFTGRHLIAHLNSEGIEISSLSLRGDQRGDAKLLAGILKERQPDYVFHLASITLGDSAEEFFRANVLYAVTLLRAMRHASLNDRPVLLVGSGAEYGQIESDALPITEDTECRPYNYYGMTKLMQTLIGLSAAKTENCPVVVARPFNVIGREMPDHLALASFALQLREIKAGRRPPVIEVGNLESVRDFIDVEDVVSLYWTLIQNNKAYGEVFNLCTGIPISVKTLVTGLIEISGMTIDVKVDPIRHKAVDIPAHYGSNSKLHKLIGDFNYKSLGTTLRRIAQ